MSSSELCVFMEMKQCCILNVAYMFLVLVFGCYLQMHAFGMQ